MDKHPALSAWPAELCQVSRHAEEAPRATRRGVATLGRGEAVLRRLRRDPRFELRFIEAPMASPTRPVRRRLGHFVAPPTCSTPPGRRAAPPPPEAPPSRLGPVLKGMAGLRRAQPTRPVWPGAAVPGPAQTRRPVAAPSGYNAGIPENAPSDAAWTPPRLSPPFKTGPSRHPLDFAARPRGRIDHGRRDRELWTPEPTLKVPGSRPARAHSAVSEGRRSAGLGESARAWGRGSGQRRRPAPERCLAGGAVVRSTGPSHHPRKQSSAN